MTLPTIVLAGQLSAAAAATEHTTWEFFGSSAMLSGSVTLADWMLACPDVGAFSVAVSVGCLPLVVWPLPERLIPSDGANGSPRQPPTWNRDDTGATAPPTDVIVAPTVDAEHDVGLTMKFGRSSVRLTVLIRNGTPSRIVGNGSETAVTCASLGSIRSDWRTTTVPRLYGPAIAGITVASP